MQKDVPNWRSANADCGFSDHVSINLPSRFRRAGRVVDQLTLLALVALEPESLCHVLPLVVSWLESLRHVLPVVEWPESLRPALFRESPERDLTLGPVPRRHHPWHSGGS